MNFKLKKPCEKCPFRTDLPPDLKGWLGKSRSEQIVFDNFFHGGTFPCHKTTETNDEGKDINLGNRIPCAGAAIMQIKADNPSQWMQIATRLGMAHELGLDQLELDSPVFDTPENFIKFHSLED